MVRSALQQHHGSCVPMEHQLRLIRASDVDTPEYGCQGCHLRMYRLRRLAAGSLRKRRFRMPTTSIMRLSLRRSSLGLARKAWVLPSLPSSSTWARQPSAHCLNAAAQAWQSPAALWPCTGRAATGTGRRVRLLHASHPLNPACTLQPPQGGTPGDLFPVETHPAEGVHMYRSNTTSNTTADCPSHVAGKSQSAAAGHAKPQQDFFEV